MIHSQTKKFLDQDPPRDDGEVAARRIQANALTERVAGIAYASRTSRSYPTAAGDIFDATRSLCDSELPTTNEGLNDLFQESKNHTSTISTICFAVRAQRLNENLVCRLETSL